MATNLVTAGLRIAASATGLGVFGGVKKSILGLESVTQQLRTKHEELGASIKRNMGTLAPQTLAALNREYLTLGQSIDRVRGKQEQLQNRMARRDMLRNQRADLRSGVLETVAIGASAALPVKLAIDYESAMADVKKVVNFNSADGFAKLSGEILDLTRSLPLAATELAQIAASGGQLGIAAPDIKQFTETVAKMATAFDMSAGAAGDSMAKLANVYKIPIAQIGNLGDAINELSNSSPAKASDIVNALSRVGGAAKAFGLSETQAAALSNTFISLGKSPEVAATAINGMLIKLQTAEKQGDKFQEALSSINMSAGELKKKIGTDAQGALQDFLGTVNLVPKADRMGLLVDLFGLEYADDVAVLAGSMETYAGSLALVKAASSYKGSMEKEFQARAATTANNLLLLKNGLTELGINVGSAVLPGLNDLVGTLRPMVTQFATWAKENPGLVSGIIKLVTGAAALKLSVIGLRYGVSLGASALNGMGLAMALASGKATLLNHALIGTRLAPVVSGVGSLTAMLPSLSGAMAVLGGVIAATPIGWIIAGVAGLAAAGLLIYKYWEPIKAWTGGFFTGLMDGLKPVSAAFSAAFAPLLPLFSGLGALLQPIATWFRELLTPLEMTGDELGRAGWSGIQFGQAVGGAISTLFAPLRFLLEGIAAIPRAFTSIANYLSIDLPAKFTDLGGMLVSGLMDGITAKASALKASVVGMGDSIKSWFTGDLKIKSPSRVFMGYGANLSEGAALGITGKAAQVRKAALSMAAATAVTLGTPQLAAADLATSTRPAALAAGAPGAGGGMTISLTQNFTINGASGGNLEAQARQAARISYEEFAKLMREHEQRTRRVSYSDI
ncbi:phage tail tape measure protein [Pseudomonas leptonychotis]|uniref:phage tail tape measure protein n=1 Tax=Pseudomonas leptonychotis TaxID=2448482 RepID=UPI00386907DF